MEERLSHHLRILIDISQQMSRTFHLRPLLETIEQASRSALGCERATIFLYDAGTDELYSEIATGTDKIRFPANRGIAGEAARTRCVVIVPDAYADPRFNPEIDRKTGYQTRNLLTLPLVTPDDDVIGVLQLLNKERGSFNHGDEQLAEALGSLTAIAIKRQMLMDEAAIKQKLERDLDIAREIQSGLLPQRDPQFDTFDIAGWNRPADQTGGDCYDFLELDDGQLLFMIADATGHGIGPALIVAQCRAMIRAVADSTTELVTIATTVNDLLCHDLTCGRFVTSCFGLLDPAAKRIDYVSAGHGPMLVYRAASREVESFNACGMPLGIVPGNELDLSTPVELQPGDMFVLLTDGFAEWAGPDRQLYGQRRVNQFLIDHADLAASDLIAALYRDVLTHAGSTPQLDDLTAIVIKRSPCP